MRQGLAAGHPGPTFAVLGSLEVTREGTPVLLRGARRRALLARLLIAANQVISSEALIDDLWPEDQPGSHANALQASLSHLRTALESGRPDGDRERTILTRPPGYVLSVDADRLDALRFERLAAEGRTALAARRPEEAAALGRRALALWRGRALAEFTDEPWAWPVAARLEDLRWAALEDRFDADLALGRHGGLVGEIETARAAQPLRERLSAQLMLSLYRSGRQADALRAYQQVRVALGDGLGIEPGPTLRELEEAILLQKSELEWVPPAGPVAAAPAPTPPPAGHEVAPRPGERPLAGVRRVSSPSFIGRVGELGRLRDAFARVGTGTPAVVVVGGEAGVGKTRLVSELAAEAAEKGARVLVGRCIDGGDVPYGPMVQALGTLSTSLDGPALEALLGSRRVELAPLLPEQAQAGTLVDIDQSAGAGRTRMLDSLVGLLGHLAQPDRLVLVLEDIHWAEHSSLELLDFLVRRLRSEPILLVATYRNDSAPKGTSLRPFLAEVSRSPLVERLDLGRFTRNEVVAQLAGILGGPPPSAVVEAIWSRSGGNAFFAEELLTMECQGRTGTLPPTLRDILLARIESLSTSAQSVVRAAAAGGLRVTHPMLAAVVPATEPELLDALREAVSHQVLITGWSDDSYSFRHALLQEATYAELLPGERRRLHADYARTLSEQPGLSMAPSAVADVANHWFAAGNLAEALPAAVAAGEAAEARYGFEEARRHFERALGAWEAVPDAARRAGTGRIELLQRAAEAACLSGDHVRAASLTSSAMSLIGVVDDPLRAGLLQERVGRYLWAGGKSEEALVAYARAAELVPDHPPSAGRARILAAQGQALMLMARYRESSSRCEEAIEIARLSGDRATEGHARNTLGFALGCLGQAEAGIAELRDVRLIAEEVHDLDDIGRALLNLSELLAGPAHRLDDALAAAMEGIGVAAHLGLDRDYGVSLRAIAANALYGLGRWGEAEKLLLDGEDLDPRGMADIDVQLSMARILVGTGRFEEARVRLDAARRLCSGAVDPQMHAPCLTTTAELALWEARPQEARHAVAEGLRHLEPTDDAFFTAPLLSLGLRAEADQAEQARADGIDNVVEEATATGRRLIERARAILGATSLPAAAGHLQTCEAELSRLDGDSSPRLWAGAALAWDRLGQPYPAAEAHWRRAEALLRTEGATAGALAALGQAEAIALRLGADPLRRAIEELIGRHGIERPPTR